MKIYACKLKRVSFAFYDYRDKYYPFGIDFGYWGIRIVIRESHFIKE